MNTLGAQTKDFKLFPTVDSSKIISLLTRQDIKHDISDDAIDENAIYKYHLNKQMIKT